MRVESKLADLEIELPETPHPMANYVPAVTTGNLVFISGHGPTRPGGTFITGKVGRDLTIEEGYEAARVTMLNCLSTLKAEIGDLDRVRRIVKLFGMVNCTEEFTEPPAVINGASDLLVAIFGDAGRHARSAVGMHALPRSIAVEIEMVVEIA